LTASSLANTPPDRDAYYGFQFHKLGKTNPTADKPRTAKKPDDTAGNQMPLLPIYDEEHAWHDEQYA